MRLWVDRAFTIGGAGTVITGTLGQGTCGSVTISSWPARDGVRGVRVRSLQSLERSRPGGRRGRTGGRQPARRPVAEVPRGDALLTPGADLLTARGGRRLRGGPEASIEALPAALVLHLGAASVPVRLRPLGAGFARLTLDWAAAAAPGDRALLRDPGRHSVAAAVSSPTSIRPRWRRSGERPGTARRRFRRGSIWSRRSPVAAP